MADTRGPAIAAGQGQAPHHAVPGAIPGTTAAGLDLHDIHLPGSPGIWPPAPGWWLLGLLVLAAAGLSVSAGWKRWRQQRRRRRVITELDRLGARGGGPALVGGVAALLKRVALTRYPSTEVAALTGDAWLGFLDRTGGDGRFRDGPGRVLAEGPYAPAAEGLDEQALLALVRDWLRRNL